jgi:hypothetical protein
MKSKMFKNNNYCENIRNVLTDATLFVIEFIFYLYLKVARVLLKMLMPLTKRLVIDRMETYGLKVNGPATIDPQVNTLYMYILYVFVFHSIQFRF